ncbi:MAG: SPFH domain-containing protein [Chloroflexota bacterium]
MGIINFVRDYERIARFRLGRFEGMKGPGIVFALPILHQITKVDTRTHTIDIPEQTNITRDNASIGIDFLLYMRVDINEAHRAVMEVEDYVEAVRGLSTTTLRAVVGDIDLDEVLSQRERINELIRSKLDDETSRWGIKVTNVEIREINPPRAIEDAMNRQMAAERERRSKVLEANGTREASVTVAEGEKQAAILKAEGEKQAAILRAEGDAQALQTIFEVARNIDANTLAMRYMEALNNLGSSESSKFILPMEFTRFLAPLANMAASSGDGGGRGGNGHADGQG